MYIIRRNNHYYKETKKDIFTKEVHHVFVRSPREAKTFENQTEAWDVLFKVNGHILHEYTPEYTAPKVKSSPQKEATQKMRFLVDYLGYSYTRLDECLYTNRKYLEALYEGNYNAIIEHAEVYLYDLLSTIPYDKNFRFEKWKYGFYNLTKDERAKIMERFSEEIRTIKEKKQATWLELEDDLGMALNTLNVFVNGSKIPAGRMLARIRKGLDDYYARK